MCLPPYYFHRTLITSVLLWNHGELLFHVQIDPRIPPRQYSSMRRGSLLEKQHLNRWWQWQMASWTSLTSISLKNSIMSCRHSDSEYRSYTCKFWKWRSQTLRIGWIDCQVCVKAKKQILMAVQKEDPMGHFLVSCSRALLIITDMVSLSSSLLVREMALEKSSLHQQVVLQPSCNTRHHQIEGCKVEHRFSEEIWLQTTKRQRGRLGWSNSTPTHLTSNHG